MLNEFSRTELILGREAIEKLAKSRVAVFGVGGVGGFTVEALARSGVGALDLIDNDKVSLTNINRQIIALHSTVGQYKVDVAAERVRDINPNCEVRTFKTFYSPENAHMFNFSEYDYIVDAIDTITAKICMIENANLSGAPIISAMGAGNKLDPTRFEVADIYKTEVCPLARVMRYELRKRGIKKLKVVYSKEPPRKPIEGVSEEKSENGKAIPASISFVPSVAGLIIAGEVIKDLTKDCRA